MNVRRLEQGDDLAPDSPKGVRVLIVEDHRLFADALRSVLERGGMNVVGVTTSGEEALAIAQREKPELVLLDPSLADMTGLSVGQRIIERNPNAKVVAVTAAAYPQAVKKAISLGFQGYLTWDSPMRQFNSSLLAILAGQVVISQHLPGAASEAASPEKRAALVLADQLSERERQILSLLVEGLNNGQIAKRLRISPNTARAHAQRILTKLQVHSRLEAAAFAVRHGLVRPLERHG